MKEVKVTFDAYWIGSARVSLRNALAEIGKIAVENMDVDDARVLRNAKESIEDALDYLEDE